MTPRLLDSFKLGSWTLRNRVALAPLTRGRAGLDRIPNDLMRTYYDQRSSAGIIITEATSISEEGLGWNQGPGIYTDAMVEGWRPVTRSLKDHGTISVLQLWHCGRASHTDFHPSTPPLSASAIPLTGKDGIRTPLGKKSYETPKAMDEVDIRRTIADYRRAAENANRAGFDGVEIHGANGYLINQFLDAKSNHRTDGYGGSIEGRSRFLKEVVTAVCQVMPAERVGIRLSPNGVFNDMGSPDFRELYSHVIAWLDTIGLGYVHLMDGLAFGFHNLGEPFTLQEARGIFKGALMGNCGYTFETANQAIQQGYADLIAFGRPFITNPDLVERFRHGYPIAPATDSTYWYTHDAQGYTDYRPYQK